MTDIFFITFNADPAHTGFSRRVKANVDSAQNAGQRVTILRFVPFRSRGWSWKGKGFSNKAKVVEILVPPIRRFRILREVSLIIASAVLRILRVLFPRAVLVAESHEAAFLCWRAGVEFVADVHGDVVAEQEASGAKHVWLAPDAAYLRSAKAVICVSERMRDSFLDEGRIATPCYVVPVGYDLEFASQADRAISLGRAALRLQLGLPVDRCIVVYSGGMQRYQRFDDICLAIKGVLAREPLAFFLVCTKSVEAALNSLSRCGLRRDVYKVLSCEPAELAFWLAASDIGLVLRNEDRINRVASPTKVLEYARTGLRVVCGGIRPPRFLETYVCSSGHELYEFEQVVGALVAKHRGDGVPNEDLRELLDAYCLPFRSASVFEQLRSLG